MSPDWYRTPSYRRRLVRWPREVPAEFGLHLPPEVEVRVHDSNQKSRFMVMPMRPAGTEEWSEEQLAAIVTRDTMIGVALPSVDWTASRPFGRAQPRPPTRELLARAEALRRHPEHARRSRGAGRRGSRRPRSHSRPWESRLQATCECLSWPGTLSNEERRRAEDELGETIYSEFPVHARPAAVTAHALLERGIVSETELQTKMYEVRARLTEA